MRFFRSGLGLDRRRGGPMRDASGNAERRHTDPVFVENAVFLRRFRRELENSGPKPCAGIDRKFSHIGATVFCTFGA